MIRTPPDGFRREAIRTATIATLLVLLVVVVLLAITDIVVAHRLTGELDQRISDVLSHSHDTPRGRFSGLGATDRDDNVPVLRWYVTASGTVLPRATGPQLPSSLRSVGAPTEATIAGAEFRASGIATGDGGRVVAAASMGPVSRATSSLILVELVVTPLLLVAVFLGALAIGRRVAAPVERMRRQQLAFTADASHELRTPLSVIQAESSLARDLPDSQLREAVTRIDAESGRMRRIVEDLLWLARIDAELPAPDFEPLDLAEVIRTTEQRFQAIVSARSLELHLSLPDASAVIRAPREWIERLCGVLVDNACRYTPAGGRVELRVEQAASRNSLSVIDTGPGIPEQERQRIFDRFHRGSDHGEGAGLGLAIASAVVHATEGRWEVLDRPEGGSIFTVSWPRGARR